MPEISRFFGIVVRMYCGDHNPPHVHAEYQGRMAMVDFDGNVIRGGIGSHAALRLLRHWIDLHLAELEENWRLARTRAPEGVRKIAPLD